MPEHPLDRPVLKCPPLAEPAPPGWHVGVLHNAFGQRLAKPDLSGARQAATSAVQRQVGQGHAPVRPVAALAKEEGPLSGLVGSCLPKPRRQGCDISPGHAPKMGIRVDFMSFGHKQDCDLLGLHLSREAG